MAKRLARVLLIFHTVVGIRSGSNSLLSKLFHDKNSSNNQSIETGCLVTNANDPGVDFACRYKQPSVNGPVTRFTGHAEPRFTDLGDNDTEEDVEMEAPSGKLSIMSLFPENEEESEEEEEEEEEEAQTEGEGEEEDYGIVGFLDDEDQYPDKLNGTKSESFLKQYHRQSLRMHHLVFPLLLAYKLKLFTIIPLLLGSLVLLVGTTGVAGFFFALFAAALGIRAKSQH